MAVLDSKHVSHQYIYFESRGQSGQVLREAVRLKSVADNVQVCLESELEVIPRMERPAAQLSLCVIICLICLQHACST